MSAADYRALMQSGKLPQRLQKRASVRPAKCPEADPQLILTKALRDRLGHSAVQSEVAGLIPGRKFRADIVIPTARLVIEFDGFKYHRSKAAFQKDRERQNLFVAHGWRVLRFFNKQVRDDLQGVVDTIVEIASEPRSQQMSLSRTVSKPPAKSAWQSFAQWTASPRFFPKKRDR
jgi:very-short-patch-repair endonuclease